MYAKASISNINNIIKIKDTFSKLSSNKVLEIHNVMFNSNQGSKLKVNMTTKGPFRKQIIISISSNNVKRVMVQSNTYVLNINYLLKDIILFT